MDVKTYGAISARIAQQGRDISELEEQVLALSSGDIAGNVPTVVSAFTNDAGYLTLATLPQFDGTVI